MAKIPSSALPSATPTNPTAPQFADPDKSPKKKRRKRMIDLVSLENYDVSSMEVLKRLFPGLYP